MLNDTIRKLKDNTGPMSPDMPFGKELAIPMAHSAVERRISFFHLQLLQAAADFLAVGLSFAPAYLLSMGGKPLPPYLTTAAALSVSCLVMFRWHGLYAVSPGRFGLREAGGVVRSVMASGLLLFFALAVVGGVEQRVVPLSASLIIAGIAVCAGRLAAGRQLRRLFNRRGERARVLVYGAASAGRDLVRRLAGSRETGLLPVGLVDDDIAEWGGEGSAGVGSGRPRSLRGCVMLSEFVDRFRVDEVLLAMPGISVRRMEQMKDYCGRHELRLKAAFDMPAPKTAGAGPDPAASVAFLRTYKYNCDELYLAVKRAFDVAMSLCMLALFSPLFLAVALVIKRCDGGPAFFVQERAGLDGRPFSMYKFRTMRVDASPYAPSPTDKEDTRITRVGRWLRKTSIDELPQFLNVLKGEMSVVGPRPEMQFIVDGYDGLQRERLRVKPGITGPWQLSGDRNRPIHENLEYDFYYIENRCMLLDLKLVAETVFFAARGI